MSWGDVLVFGGGLVAILVIAWCVGQRDDDMDQLVLLTVLDLGPGETYSVPIWDQVIAWYGEEVSLSSIYESLDRLETKGYVRSRYADATEERGWRRKRLIAITPEGSRAIMDGDGGLAPLGLGSEKGGPA